MSNDPREQIYDARINPLMAQIIRICEENQIPFVASFQLSSNEEEDGALLCTSASLPNGSADALVKARDVIYQPQPFWAFTITKKEQ